MRRLRSAALAVLLLLPAGAGAQIVKYRTPDGQVGFAQDLSGVPAGAEVVTTAAQGREIEISPQAAGAPPPASPAGSAARRPGGRAAALQAADRAQQRRESRANRIHAEISQTQGQLEQAIADRKKACRKRARTPANRPLCNQAREAQRGAEKRLEMIRQQLEDDFEDVEEYFPPEEEPAYGDDSGDDEDSY